MSAAKERDFKEIFSIKQLISKNSLLRLAPSFESILARRSFPVARCLANEGANINAWMPALQAFYQAQ
ncbi:hypothetical protein CBM2595_A60006 [Cupriavidus taiwanensis]|nr:hypothetical protein CBM2595_A60006 [Cupriavidus taiwanensis]